EGSMQYLFNAPEDPVYSPNRHAKGGGYMDGDENLRFKEQETTTAPDLRGGRAGARHHLGWT
ncbi:hypothetical protein ACGLFO_07910, partial [Corynebacterium hesseae]|uniref:hypothetical protein n=1 Tax=Corynebacterium hesseae TaxID=2913502 RepID=UPI00373F96B6